MDTNSSYYELDEEDVTYASKVMVIFRSARRWASEKARNET